MSKINQNWIFGDQAGISFANIGSPQPLTSALVISSGHNEGCASISDNNGVLRFYTNGIKIWNGSHIELTGQNGIPTALTGHNSSTQSSIIVPDPSSANKYYIFTADFVGGTNHVSSFLLDISTESGTSVNIYNSTSQTDNNVYTHTEKIIAIQHSNCKDFWVITIVFKKVVKKGTTIFQSYFRIWNISASGVQFHGEIDMMSNHVHRSGYLKGSPNGKLLANVNGSHVVVYDFDNTGGNFAIPGRETIPHTQDEGIGIYGVEFSPSSEHLFYGNLGRAPNSGETIINKGRIFHVDLNSSNPVPLAKTQVGVDIDNSGGEYAIGALQLAIDGKIYFAKDNERQLGAIENPNLGLGCTVQPAAISWLATEAGLCRLGLPNLLPNPCEDECNCGCSGCNKDAETQNTELIERAKTKYNTIKSRNTCVDPFGKNCENTAINTQVSLEPCFYFHWGDGSNDQIEEHDTEVFYITVCNDFNDIKYNGLRITKITLIPNIHPINKIQIVPDRFINLDCLEPCSCQTREFAMITRADDTAGTYKMEVEYCFESVEITSKPKKGKVEFVLEITED